MKKAEEKPAVEMTVGGKPKSGASHPPWKSLRDSHIPTARRLLYIFKTFARKEPSSAIASGYGFRLILRLEKTVTRTSLERISTRHIQGSIASLRVFRDWSGPEKRWKDGTRVRSHRTSVY